MMEFRDVVFPYQERCVCGTIVCEGPEIIRVEIGQEQKKDRERSCVIPGFIDTHTHGYRGRSSECGELEEYLGSYLERGTTTVCPTVGPRPLAEYGKLVKRYENVKKGAHVPGLHLEGPYLNPIRRGAIDAESIYDIHLDALQEFLCQYGQGIAVMTIAPELASALEAVKLLSEHGVRVSFGHTDARFQEAAVCYQKGMCQATHVFNGMRPLNHHEAGVLDFILKNRIPCEMICDGNHVARETMEWFIQAMGDDGVHCISDGGESCGYSYPEGCELAPGTVIHRGAVWERGILAGSTRDLLDGFYSLLRDFHYPLWKAVRLTSTNAADFLRLPCGRIEAGYRADLLVLDEEYQITEVYLDGLRVK